MIRIYCDRLNSRYSVEEEGYALYQLAADIGGIVGTFVGISCISLVEFAHCLIGLFVYFATDGKHSIM